MIKRFPLIMILAGLTTLLLFACTPAEEPSASAPIVTVTSGASLPPNETSNDEPLSEPIEDREWVLTTMLINGEMILSSQMRQMLEDSRMLYERVYRLDKQLQSA